MTPKQRFEFMKTGQGHPFTGALLGAATGIGIQAYRLREVKKGVSARQKVLKVAIAKQQIETENYPTRANIRELATLHQQYAVASYLKKNPAIAMGGTGTIGAIIGGIAGGQS